MRMTLVTAAAFVVGIALTGCSDLAYWGNNDAVSDTRPEIAPTDSTQQLADAPDEVEVPKPAIQPGWTCVYVPTYNRDWHDDALCSNGTDLHRPYLLEGDDFVTEAELMDAARAYAAELNASQ